MHPCHPKPSFTFSATVWRSGQSLVQFELGWPYHRQPPPFFRHEEDAKIPLHRQTISYQLIDRPILEGIKILEEFQKFSVFVS